MNTAVRLPHAVAYCTADLALVLSRLAALPGPSHCLTYGISCLERLPAQPAGLYCCSANPAARLMSTEPDQSDTALRRTGTADSARMMSSSEACT